MCIPEEDCPDDDIFFEYFRALTFAHPFETSRPKFLKNRKEIQYSPWVIVNRRFTKMIDKPDTVGVRIYTNKSDDILSLRIPFPTLKEYIQSKYQGIELLINWAEETKKNVEAEWKEHKIDRNQPSEKILGQIEEILNERYSSTYIVRRAMKCLTCSVTDTANEEPVKIFKHAIENVLPEVCDAVDNLDENEMDRVLCEVISAHVKGHSECIYMLQKIYEYLDEDEPGDTRWGLIQTRHFAKGFAKKWVLIRPEELSFTEIQLLIRTACYLEARSQTDQEKNDRNEKTGIIIDV